METIWKCDRDIRSGCYIAKVTRQHDYYVVAENVQDSLFIHKEDAVEIADALYKAEGVDLRAEVSRLTAERDRMREALENIILNGIDMPPHHRREELINHIVDIANVALQSEESTDD